MSRRINARPGRRINANPNRAFNVVAAVTFLSMFALAATPWTWNLIKFLDCDFEADYKCEVIHATGVFVPPLSLITVWFAGDD